MLSVRTKLSLCQFLLLQDEFSLGILLEKQGILAHTYGHLNLEDVRASLLGAPADRLQSLSHEILRTRGDLRNRVSPRYRYDERWNDLVLCLRLDGYSLEGENLVAVDPTIEANSPVEDDLSAELRRSGLTE